MWFIVAGLPSDLLVEAHGTFASATCTACGRGYSLDDIRPKMARGHVPYCFNEDCSVRHSGPLSLSQVARPLHTSQYLLASGFSFNKNEYFHI